jgi:tRNA dimethylallyltransferase
MSLKSPKKLIVVAGATAVGKTAMTLKLAQYLNCAILSADSRQCYKELGIAVAKPSAEELAAAPHYFINSHSIHEEVTAAVYEAYGLEILEQQFTTHDYCILSGGSGLYIQALCEGLDIMPEVDPQIKSELQHQWEQKGTDWLAQQVKEVDPDYYDQADLKNHRRLLRALEVFRTTNIPFSKFRHSQSKSRPFEIIRIVLDRPRAELYQRIDQRMDEMIKQGLFEEAQELYPFKHLKPLQTVGYQEVFDFMDNQYSREEAVRLLKRNSRRYAKRQLTWFRKDDRNQWISAEDWKRLLELATA